MTSIQIEEKSLELAMVKAASRLGVTQDELGYKLIKKSDGFFGLFGKKVCIEVWALNGSKRLPMNSKPCVGSGDDLADEMQEFLSGIYNKMFGRSPSIKSRLDADRRLILDIQCDALASQFKSSSKLAEALEHLLRKRPRNIKSDLPFRVFVDAKNVRLEKEKELVNMAKDLSNKVHANQKPVILNSQSPYDRKIIHLALDKDQRVYTKSIGVGQNRKLMILPAKEANG